MFGRATITLGIGPHSSYFWNNSVKNELISVILGTQNPKEISHLKINTTISPAEPSHSILRNSKK